MRKLYIFLTFLLSVTCIISLMVASAELFNRYEMNTRLNQLKATAEQVPAVVVDKQIENSAQALATDETAGRAQHRVYVRIEGGGHIGEVMSQTTSAAGYASVASGEKVTVLIDNNNIHILELASSDSGQPWLFLALTLLSLAGVTVLVRRIKRMPV